MQASLTKQLKCSEGKIFLFSLLKFPFYRTKNHCDKQLTNSIRIVIIINLLHILRKGRFSSKRVSEVPSSFPPLDRLGLHTPDIMVSSQCFPSIYGEAKGSETLLLNIHKQGSALGPLNWNSATILLSYQHLKTIGVIFLCSY